MHEGEAKKPPNQTDLEQHKFISPNQKDVYECKCGLKVREIVFSAEIFLMSMTATILCFAKCIYCTKIFLFLNIVSAQCLVLKIKDAHP